MNEEDLYELSARILTKGSKFIPDLFRMVADEGDRIMLATPGTAEELARGRLHSRGYGGEARRALPQGPCSNR